jgi:hypothetical protein
MGSPSKNRASRDSAAFATGAVVAAAVDDDGVVAADEKRRAETRSMSILNLPCGGPQMHFNATATE